MVEEKTPHVHIPLAPKGVYMVSTKAHVEYGSNTRIREYDNICLQHLYQLLKKYTLAEHNEQKEYSTEFRDNSSVVFFWFSKYNECCSGPASKKSGS